MTKDSHDPSVFDEPHLRGKPFEADRSEVKADPTMAKARAKDQAEEERIEQSVWDEPGISPALAGVAPEGELTYRDWVEKRRGEFSAAKSWGITLLIAAAAGPWAVLGVFVGSGSVYDRGTAIGAMVVCVVGPVIEEMMKVAAGLYIVEKRPFFFRSRIQIALCAIAGGFAFACIENVLYLHVYVPIPPPGLVRWRWTICVALHTGCSFIASLGLMRIWEDVWKRRARPRIHLGFPYLVTAVVLHGAYNAFALVLALTRFHF